MTINVDPNTSRRLNDLLKWGYVEVTHDARWFVTEKGWRLMLAAAEPPPVAPVKGKVV